MHNFSIRNWGFDSRKYTAHQHLFGMLLGVVIFGLAFVCFSLIDIIRVVAFYSHATLPTHNPNLLLTFVYAAVLLVSLAYANYCRTKKHFGNLYIVIINITAFFGITLANLLDFVLQMALIKIYSEQLGIDVISSFKVYWSVHWLQYVIVIALICFIIFLRWRMKNYKINVQRNSFDTSGNLGKAQFATEHDIKKKDLRSKYGSLIGKDNYGYIRMPKLTDRLILAYRGGGKTSSLLIPFILDNPNINKLITDIKGELSAVTAKRAIRAGRKVYIIDPFKALTGLGVNLPTHGINPLKALKCDDPLERDRYISALAAAICSGDYVARNETESHFLENAQIILEGLLDYYVSKNINSEYKLNLVAFHDWWLDVVHDKKGKLLDGLKKGSSKARAALAQMTVAGKDESGSMKTTIYRQLQWLRSDNIRKLFLKDDVQISDYVSGNCDIYVVLPEDMVKGHSRVVRLIMALIKVKLVQAQVHSLKKDYCFVLDELGQFGYCPDVEQVIATLRGRGVKVWASFQTIGQIEVYRDDATFKGMPVKHFLNSDDPKTLQWIKQLGGQTTVLTENVSRSLSDSHRSITRSSSENYSVSEVATDLIHFNDIREMPDDEQFVFIKGVRVIRCKNVYYFKDPLYKGRYDQNPLEMERR